jgi:hypothetical protein
VKDRVGARRHMHFKKHEKFLVVYKKLIKSKKKIFVVYKIKIINEKKM